MSTAMNVSAVSYTPKLITELGYLGFEVSDLGRWQQFMTEVIGMAFRPGPLPGTGLVRMDHYDRRFVFSQGSTDDFAFAGWQSPNAQSLAEFAEHLERLGITYQWGDSDETLLRGVDRMLHFKDPNGLRHEAYYGPAMNAERFVSSKVQAGFITGAGGMGHAVFPAPEYSKTLDFMQRVFGMAISDYVRLRLSAEMSAEIAFLHVNPRHHSIAFAQIPGPKKLHHFMVEAGSVADVGRARDRCLAMGLPVTMDIGQHPNDGMLSFYGQTPSGFLVEFGYGGILVDDANWHVASYSQISEWGHRPAPAPINTTRHAQPGQIEAKEENVQVIASAHPKTDQQESAGGRWHVTMNTPMGDRKVTFDLHVDGSTVRGSMIAPDETNEILQGSATGQSLHWRAKVSKPLPMDIEIHAQVSGNSITGAAAGPLGSAPFSGVRG